MPIIASNNSTPRELIPAGNYIARCYQMLEIGTITEVVMGKQKIQQKVRIGWELPLETKVFKEENGEQPLVISKEYTLSMNEKANLRLMLKSWRGKDFTEEEAKAFDITKLLGVPCMLNVIHKPSKSDPTKIYEEIAGITPVPKGITVPPQVNKTLLLQYDAFDRELFESLPDFIKTKIQSSLEYAAINQPHARQMDNGNDDQDDLPF